MNAPQILVTVNQEGQVQIRSNVENRALAVGLLEMAKKAIMEPPAQEPSPILVARNGLPGHG